MDNTTAQTRRWWRSAALTAVAGIVLAGCGGGDGTTWGIDHGRETPVPHGPLDQNTGLYRCTLDDAVLIPAGSEVRPLSSDTQVRVWHFQNSDEYVCVLKGEAVYSVPGQGA